MPEKIEHSGIYERLVSNERDFLGQVAYSIYKSRKRAFIINKSIELGVSHVPEEVVSEFVKAQDDLALELYRNSAKDLFREFLDASCGEKMEQAEKRLKKEYDEKLDNFVKYFAPKSWWYGVGQSFAASFLFLLAGYVILKTSGSWDVLLSNLLR